VAFDGSIQLNACLVAPSIAVHVQYLINISLNTKHNNAGCWFGTYAGISCASTISFTQLFAKVATT